MENGRKEDKICFDQIEKIMQDLDATNTESNSSTPHGLDVPHRPIILPPEIKEEPKDKDTEISPQNDVCSNNEIVAVPTQISDSDPKYLSNIQGQHTHHEVQIKKERVDGCVEVPVEPPETVEDINDSETQNAIQKPVEVQAIRIKPEPVDASSLATEKISLQNTATTDASSENATKNKGEEAPTETNMDDSTAPNSPIGMPEVDGALPHNFFDDLIKDADNITAAALESSAPNAFIHETEPTEMLVNVKKEPVDTTTNLEETATAALQSTEAVQQQPQDSTEQNITTPEHLNVKHEPVDTADVLEATTSAPIPENFFDDLLVDHVAERIDDVVNHDLEIKYSERLKELEQLKAKEQGSHKAHKKHKKKKKKSHKRTHSEVNEDEEALNANHKRSKHASRSHSKSPQSMPHDTCIRVKSEFSTSEKSRLPGGTLSSNHQRPDTFNLDSVEPETSAAAARRMIRVKSEFGTNQPVAEESDVCLPVKEIELFQGRSNINRNGLIVDMTAPLGFTRIKMESDEEKLEAAEFILPKDKMEYSKQRAILAIEEFNKANKKPKNTAFIYTSTVRKLPNSDSYIRQQIYDNRSPLHNVNNVSYKFNSYANHFNLHDWGIEAIPPKASEVAKILGFDIHALAKKKETFILPPEIQKITREQVEQTENQLTDTQTSFLRSSSTQTDEVTVLNASAKHRKNGHDIAVQTIPRGNNIGTQTTAISAPGSNNYDDLPLMREISTLNENQLMALSDFADLIRETSLAADASAIDLYRLRQRMMDIYKCSQLPSELGLNTQQSSKYSIHDPHQKRMNSVEESPPPPPPRFLPQYAQPSIRAIISQNMRDPRQERRLAMQETQPQPWPHAVVRPPYHRPLAPMRQQTTLPKRQRLEPAADMSYKIPVIENVASLRHNGLPPTDPRQHTFDGGAMRR